MKKILIFVIVVLVVACSKKQVVTPIIVSNPKSYEEKLALLKIKIGVTYTVYMYDFNPSYTKDSIVFNNDSSITETMYQPYFWGTPNLDSVASFSFPIVVSYINKDTITMIYDYSRNGIGVRSIGDGIIGRELHSGTFGGDGKDYLFLSGDSAIYISISNPQNLYSKFRI